MTPLGEPDTSGERWALALAAIDVLSETADERAEEVLGVLGEYAEMIVPELY